jgi:c-di-GMP-binding flagellar brake protein YcgR
MPQFAPARLERPASQHASGRAIKCPVPPKNRRHERIKCNLTFRGGGAATNLAGRITDLSGTGVFIVTRRFVPVGKQVHLEFDLPSGKVEAVGEVRRVARGEAVGEAGLGVRFLRLSASSARAIDEAIGLFTTNG